jgi:hypothetical protein
MRALRGRGSARGTTERIEPHQCAGSPVPASWRHLQEQDMTRKIAATPAPAPLQDALELMQLQQALFTQFASLQGAWVSSWWLMQSRLMGAWEWPPAQIPPWLVWQNGTEQLG